jgi:hypothetical protein
LEDENKQPAAYLKSLIDLSKVQEVNICNSGIDSAVHFPDPDEKVAWSNFSSAVCHNFIAVGLHDLTIDAQEWL